MIITTPENNFSWLRQDREPEASYKWFTYYRDMKGTRRLTKVADLMKEKEPYLERYPSYNEVKKASSTWSWKRRTVDYDNYLQIQLIESHKQTLIVYEEESIDIDKKIFKALNTEIDKIINNQELPSDKKIKALREAQRLNKELLGGIEHIANTEIPEVSYIDVNKTRENDIINSLLCNSKGYLKAGTLEDVLDGYTSEDVEDVINRYINEQESNRWNTFYDDQYTNVVYDGKSYNIPDK